MDVLQSGNVPRVDADAGFHRLMNELVDVLQLKRLIGQTADYLRRRDLGQLGWQTLSEVRQQALEETVEDVVR